MTRILAYTMPQVVRLTNVTARQLAYWEDHDVFKASYIDDRPGRAYRRIYSFSDVVSLRTLGILRNEQKVVLDEIRKTGKYLSGFAEFPWTQKFWVLNGEVHFNDPVCRDVIRNLVGQSSFVVEIDRIRAQVEIESSHWNQRDPEDYGQVSRHRHIQHNRWVVKGTRVPTATLWGFSKAGYDIPEIQKQYPSLTKKDIEAAIEHEQSLRESVSAA